MKLGQLLVPVVAILVVLVCICDGMPRGTNNKNHGKNSKSNMNSLCGGSNGNRDNENRPNVGRNDIEKKCKGFKYLKNYFMVEGVSDDKTGPTTPAITNFKDGVKKLQRMAGLAQTGSIDEPTARVMTWPRCGNKDNLNVAVTVSEDALRNKRFVVTGGIYKWNKDDLTYKISNYPDTAVSVITKPEVDEAVADAFKLWSDATPLTFTRIPATSTADIVLVFGKGTHTSFPGDPPFDGQGGTLAHAFTPNSGWGNLNGDVHLDDDETFTHTKYFGRNLLYVTAHELGHALGLAHSDVRGALMWPFILGYTPNYNLPEDDKLGIQVIYGVNPNPPAEEPTNPPPSTTAMPLPIYCNLTFDDVEVIRGEIFAFSAKKFWRFSYDGHLINSLEGTSIRSFFKGAPGVVSAVVERWFDEKVLLAKGKKIWQLTGNVVDDGFPKLLAEMNVSRMVDCAMHRASDGITYYFKDKLVYAYDEFEEVLSEAGPVKVHKVFKGIPRGTRVTAAFTGLDGIHYLIVNKDYYKVEPNQQSDGGLSNLQSNGVLSNFGQDFLNCPTA